MDTKTIGGKIAGARKGLNISQAQLAERLFISPQAVGKWERGESVPDILMFNRLAALLGVDLNYFSESFRSLAEPTPPPMPPAPAPPPARLNWDMSNGHWKDADFSGLKDLHERFGSSNLQRCRFVESDLSGLLLAGNHVDKCDFLCADLSRSRLKDSHIVGTNFKGASLAGAELTGCHIKGCDFTETDLTNAALTGCAFEKNVLAGAVLTRTRFTGTHLSDTVITGPVQDCAFTDCAFMRVTFENCRLTNTFFKGRGLKSLRFVNCQADRLTLEFLKNGRADVGGVEVI